MAEPSAARTDTPSFGRGRFLLGILLVSVVGVGAAFAFGTLRSETVGPSDRVVFVSGAFLMRLDPRTGEEGAVARLPEDADDFVADQRSVVFRHAGLIWRLDVNAGALSRVARGRPVGLSPHGSLVFSPRPGQLLVGIGARRDLVPGDLQDPGRPVWIGPDLYALTGRDDDGEAMYVVSMGERSLVIRERVSSARPLAASPDGAELLYAEQAEDAEELKILAIEEMKSEELGRGGIIGEFFDAAASPQGVLAYSARRKDGNAGVFFIGDASWLPATSAPTTLRWSTDGRVLYALADGRITAFTVDGGPAGTVTEGARGSFLAVVS